MTQTALSLSALSSLPPVRGRLTENAPLGTVGWFRCGGTAEILFKPADADDLAAFLAALAPEIPVTVLGVMSNTIVRDGGVRGVVIRPGKEFATIETEGTLLRSGAVALDGNVAAAAARAGIAGLEFFSGIPSTIGGALRMNAGCYGTETKDVLVSATAIDRRGTIHTLTPAQMGMAYRHTDAPADYIFTHATFQGRAGDADAIKAHMDDIKSKRNTSQPIREKTGGSTFANPSPDDIAKAGLPEGTKVWQMIDRAGCRGLMVGGAQMSELHCNFMINIGTATAADLENLGEEVRKRVYEDCGITLRWEVKRIGENQS
ncbi:MAG: UDP-N-acetylmuramate dehydrogenase [Alphaproteobacteria bacterium]|nr:UDP-N-acetylmuramate dehydrogenase [Alphaproteobacteria bacterium]